MKSYLLSLLYFFCVFTPALAQTEHTSSINEVWSARAEMITANLIKEAAEAEQFERAVIYANLADIWMPSDSSRAKDWLKRSVDVIYFLTSDQIKDGGPKYFTTLKTLLPIVFEHDKTQSDRLLSLVLDNAKSGNVGTDLDANIVMDIALEIVRIDPEIGGQLGIMAFDYGQPQKLHQMYWQLKRSNEQTADRFIRAAVNSVRNSPSLPIAAELRTSVFPELNFPDPPKELVAPDRIKSETLAILADLLSRQFAAFVSKTADSCSMEATFVSPLSQQFGKLLPARKPEMDQAVKLCLSKDEGKEGVADINSHSATDLNDLDTLLKLANEAEEINTRVYYLLRAVSLANDKELFRRAIDILNKMTEEERKIDQSFWDELRYTISAGWAFQQFKSGDVKGSLDTLNEVPENTRPFARTGFAMRCKPDEVEMRPFCLDMIREADKEIFKISQPFRIKSSFIENIIRLYAEFGNFDDASNAFEKYLQAFNDEGDDPTNDPFASFNGMKKIVSADLFNAKDVSILEAVRKLKASSVRTNCYLGLLSIAVSQVRSENT